MYWAVSTAKSLPWISTTLPLRNWLAFTLAIHVSPETNSGPRACCGPACEKAGRKLSGRIFLLNPGQRENAGWRQFGTGALVAARHLCPAAAESAGAPGRPARHPRLVFRRRFRRGGDPGAPGFAQAGAASEGFRHRAGTSGRRAADALSPYLAGIRHEEAAGRRRGQAVPAGAGLPQWRARRPASSRIPDAGMVPRRRGLPPDHGGWRAAAAGGGPGSAAARAALAGAGGRDRPAVAVSDRA